MNFKTHPRLFFYVSEAVCGGNIANSLPSMMTWTRKKGARSEPAEMGVPFSDHSAISRSNKNTHLCSFICGIFLKFVFVHCRFLTELGIEFFFSLL